MKTTCRDHEWMIGPLVDGELPPAEAEEAEKHLRSCEACAKLAEDFRAFDRLARRIEEPPPVSALEWAKILERVRREPTVIRLGARRGLLDWLVPALSMAALVLFGAFAIVGVLMKHNQEPPQLNSASVEVLMEKDNPKIKVEERDDAVIIHDTANL